jgi:hypothetical protein
MRVGKILAILVVSLASVIVVAAAIVTISFLVSSRGARQQNFAPSKGQQAVSPVGDVALFSQPSGNSSFLYRKDPSSGTKVRLTEAAHGIESEPNFSRDGKLVVYSSATSPDAKSQVWVVGADGRNAHPITGNDEDALHPVFLLMAQKCSTRHQILQGITRQSSAPLVMIGTCFPFLFKRMLSLPALQARGSVMLRFMIYVLWILPRTQSIRAAPNS